MSPSTTTSSGRNAGPLGWISLQRTLGCQQCSAVLLPEACLRPELHPWTCSSVLLHLWPSLGPQTETSTNTPLSARGVKGAHDMSKCAINSTCSVLDTNRDASSGIKIFIASKKQSREHLLWTEGQCCSASFLASLNTSPASHGWHPTERKRFSSLFLQD